MDKLHRSVLPLLAFALSSYLVTDEMLVREMAKLRPPARPSAQAALLEMPGEWLDPRLAPPPIPPPPPPLPFAIDVSAGGGFP